MILNNKAIKRVHCMGIGGIGVSGLAEMLLQKGYQVTGSDPSDNSRVQRLRQLGVMIYAEHKAENINNIDALVYSSAIDPQNPEFAAAKAAGVPMVLRGQLLAEFMQLSNSIAVSGTHGKTTTTALIAHMLLEADMDPTYVNGGILNNQQKTFHIGQGDYFVAEADESDASFLLMSPKIAVITNIDADHLSTYADNFQRLKQSFIEFLQKIPEDGCAILGIDDPEIRAILPQVTCRVITCG